MFYQLSVMDFLLVVSTLIFIFGFLIAYGAIRKGHQKPKPNGPKGAGGWKEGL